MKRNAEEQAHTQVSFLPLLFHRFYLFTQIEVEIETQTDETQS